MLVNKQCIEDAIKDYTVKISPLLDVPEIPSFIGCYTTSQDDGGSSFNGLRITYTSNQTDSGMSITVDEFISDVAEASNYKEVSEMITSKLNQILEDIESHYLFTDVVTGYGAFHTANPEGDKPKPYSSTCLYDIPLMIVFPNSVAKAGAKWVIFSTYLSDHARSASHQREHGHYIAGWADIDTGNHSLDDIRAVMDYLETNYMVYSSKSATEDNKKWRVIVPYKEALDADTHSLWCESFNDQLQSKGITPDPVNKRVAQLCYLPNRGNFYEYHIENSRGDLA
jgi:hypothetical protein